VRSLCEDLGLFAELEATTYRTSRYEHTAVTLGEFGPSDGGGGASGGDGPGGEGEANGGGDYGGGGDSSYDGTDRRSGPVGGNTPMGQENDIDSQENQFDNYGGFGTEQQAADQSGYSIAGIEAYDDRYDFGGSKRYTADYNSTTGFTTVTYSSFLGVDVDAHIAPNGVTLGIADEMAADFLEVVGIQVTQANVDVSVAAASLVVGVAIGVPIATSVLNAVDLAASIAEKTGTISKETADKVRFAAAVAKFSMSVMATMQVASMTMSYYSQMTTVGKLAAVAITAYSASSTYGQLEALERTAAAYGFTTTDVTVSDLDAFDRDSGDGYEGDASTALGVMGAYRKLLQWKVANNPGLDRDQDITTRDVFDSMAGSAAYNAFFGGGEFAHPLNPLDGNKAAVGLPQHSNEYAVQALLGSEFVFKKNTKNADGGTYADNNAIRLAKETLVRQIVNLQTEANRLIDDYNSSIEERNALVAQYSGEVSTWNSHAAANGSGYDYAAAQGRLDSLGTSINSYDSRLTDYVDQITDIQDEVTILAERL